MSEGYIKFNVQHKNKVAEWSKDDISVLNSFRDEVYKKKLIGFLADEGVGYGNISMRYGGNSQFLISGNATGKYKKLELRHYSKVLKYDVINNACYSEGSIKPSSESGTHAVIYSTFPLVNFVLHIHNTKIWKSIIEKNLFIDESITYGSPEMAIAVKKFLKTLNMSNHGFFAMKGHENGAIFFGQTVEEIQSQLKLFV